MLWIIVILTPFCMGKYSYTPCTARNKSEQCDNSDYSPVCGIKSTGLPYSYQSPCSACSDSNVVSYIPGLCIDQVSQCPFIRPVCRERSSDFVYSASCAFEQGKSPKNINTNLCCSNETFTSLLEEPCPTHKPETSPGASKCPSNRILSCIGAKGGRVCGISLSRRRFQFLNWCMACMNPLVTMYIDGPCPAAGNTTGADFKVPLPEVPTVNAIDVYNYLSLLRSRIRPNMNG